MISRKGLIHHLDNIEHQAGIFARTASELAHESAQNSKTVVLKHFDLQNRGPLSRASQPYDGTLYHSSSGDQKYCHYCSEFFPLNDYQREEWHIAGKCQRETIDVMIELKAAPGYPARVEQFIDVQRSEEIPLKALEGYRIREVFSDSIGRLVVTYEKGRA